MKKTVPRCLPAPPRTEPWSLGDSGCGFLCSAFRRNPAKEQRSGEKCWYLFIQEDLVNNTDSGAFETT